MGAQRPSSRLGYTMGLETGRKSGAGGTPGGKRGSGQGVSLAIQGRVGSGRQQLELQRVSVDQGQAGAGTLGHIRAQLTAALHRRLVTAVARLRYVLAHRAWFADQQRTP